MSGGAAGKGGAGGRSTGGRDAGGRDAGERDASGSSSGGGNSDERDARGDARGGTDATAKCTGEFGKGKTYPIQSTLSVVFGGITLSSNGLEAYTTGYVANQPPRIYRLTRKAETEEFGDPEEFVGDADAGQREELDPTLSPDALSLFYMVVAPWGMNPESTDIFVSRRSSPDERFGPGAPPSPLLNDPFYRDVDPFVSHDGKTLYFVNARSGTSDIYTWEIGTESAPVPLLAVNTSSYHERSPVLTEDGLTIFFGSNRNGFGTVDIYRMQRANATDGFGSKVELLEETKTDAREYPEDVSHDGCTLWYTAENAEGSHLQTTTRSRD